MTEPPPGSPESVRRYLERHGPDRMHCPLCSESIGGEQEPTTLIGIPDGRMHAHRECLLRSVMGGIGHLTDHNHWCHVMHDPDGGRTYRQSALEVDAWVREHGTVTT